MDLIDDSFEWHATHAAYVCLVASPTSCILSRISSLLMAKLSSSWHEAGAGAERSAAELKLKTFQK